MSICPKCEADMVRRKRLSPEPDVGFKGQPSGWACTNCEHEEDDQQDDTPYWPERAQESAHAQRS